MATAARSVLRAKSQNIAGPHVKQRTESTVSKAVPPEIPVEELKQRLDAGEEIVLLDVRAEHEYEISNIGGLLIPLPELPGRLNELDATREIVAICKVGIRSAKAVALLREAGFQKARNLTGGIYAWSDRIDPRVMKY